MKYHSPQLVLKKSKTKKKKKKQVNTKNKYNFKCLPKYNKRSLLPLGTNSSAIYGIINYVAQNIE